MTKKNLAGLFTSSPNTALLDDRAISHDDDAVGKMSGLPEIMGNQKDGLVQRRKDLFQIGL